MSELPPTPPEPANDPDADQIYESIVRFISTISRRGRPIAEGHPMFFQWQNRLAPYGINLPMSDSLEDRRSIGRFVDLPRKYYTGVVHSGLCSALAEVTDLPAGRRTLIAFADWRADLHKDANCNGKRIITARASYQMFVTPHERGKGDGELYIGLEIVPDTKPPYELPFSLEEIWDTFELESVYPCPTTGPLPETRLRGRHTHIRALINFILQSPTARE